MACSFYKSATKTHRALDEVRKLHEGVVLELWAEFIKTRPADKSTKAFVEFALHNDDATVRFVAELVFVYAGAIMSFVEAVRNNDSDGMRAARTAFLPVWFGRNHPTYQPLLLADELMRLRAPAPVLQQLRNIEAVSRCLKHKHEGELHTAIRVLSRHYTGIGAVMEQYNRQTKLGSKPVTFESVLQVCRSMPVLNNVRLTRNMSSC